ncbi:hypothetical protein [Pleurocapsa sp. FMAR1]|uniref:hypothetical protein n=1 Tax=Pleurocapsa sp. FMAR1 TaxID=3040204 RepID=UPI0029C6C416|nr:hypothetical protein [Pleurocapsa sp. FMAR1]
MFKQNKLSIGLCLGISLALVAGLNSSATAQTQSDYNGYQSNEKDATYGDAPGGLNPLDLMHRAQQLNRRSSAEFNAESQVQIQNSVSNYKQLQQQRILEQQKSNATPTDTEAQAESSTDAQ